MDCMSESDLNAMLYEPKHARNVAVTSRDPAPLHRPGHKVTIKMRWEVMQVQGRTLQTTKTLFSCLTLLAPKKSYIFGFSQIVSSSCIPNSLSAETALCTGGDTSAT